jgi:general secretion pathway protein M
MKKLKLPNKLNLPRFNFSMASLSSLPTMLSGLNRRERLVVYAGAAALIVFLILQLIIFPVFDKRAKLHAEIVYKRIALQEIHELKAEFDAITRTSQMADTEIKKRAKNFTLFSFLDSLAGESGIKQNIGYMKPSTSNLKNSSYVLSTVEIKLQSITMKQMVAFLHGIEMSGEHVWVKRMSLTRDDKKEGLLNSIIQVETYQR